MRKGIVKTLLIIIFLTASAFSAVNYSEQISQVENNFFGIDYPKETEAQRLKRIETVLYGTEQKGTTESRIKKIAQDTGTTFETKKVQKNQETLKDNINVPLPHQTGSTQPPKDNYVAEDSTVDYPIVDKMEEKVFKKTYKSENIYKRLDRLETKVFNKTNNDVLNTRVERLSYAILYNSQKTAANKDNDSSYLPYPQQIKKNTQQYSKYSNANDTGTYDDDNLSTQLAALERANFNTVYINESIGQRLNRLEQHMLGKTFPQDNSQTRAERLMTVNVAQKNSYIYDNNKTMRNVATFSQIGGILLMILAMLL